MSLESLTEEWEKRKKGLHNPEAYIKQHESNIEWAKEKAKAQRDKASRFRDKANKFENSAKNEVDITKKREYERIKEKSENIAERCEQNAEQLENTAKRNTEKLEALKKNPEKSVKFERYRFDAGGSSIRHINQTVRPYDASRSILWAKELDSEDNTRVLDQKDGEKVHGHIVIRPDGTQVYKRITRGETLIDIPLSHEFEKHKETIVNSDKFEELSNDEKNTLKRKMERDIDSQKRIENSRNKKELSLNQHKKAIEHQNKKDTQLHKTEISRQKR